MALQTITICLQGNLTEDALARLAESVAQARQRQCPIAIDMSEVTLVDRKAVQYFCREMGPDLELINCPRYLSRWITGPDKGKQE